MRARAHTLLQLKCGRVLSTAAAVSFNDEMQTRSDPLRETRSHWNAADIAGSVPFLPSAGREDSSRGMWKNTVKIAWSVVY